MRCAVACFPAPISANTRTGTSLWASSRITASTGRILALTPSTNARIAGSVDEPSLQPFPPLGNKFPIFAFLLKSVLFPGVVGNFLNLTLTEHERCHRRQFPADIVAF